MAEPSKDRDKAVDDVHGALCMVAGCGADDGTYRVLDLLWQRAQEAERAELKRDVETLLKVHETEIAALTYGKLGVIRSTNARHATRTLQRRFEDLIRNRAARASEEPKP